MAVIDPTNLRYYLSGGPTNADPNKSLGGAKSDVLLATGLHALFDPVKGDEASAGVTDYRCVYFQNDDANLDGLMDPVRLWVAEETTNPRTSLALGLDTAGKNGVAIALADEAQVPFGVVFVSPTDKASGIALPDDPYTEGDHIAIWIRRTVQPGASADPSDGGSFRVEGDTV